MVILPVLALILGGEPWGGKRYRPAARCGQPFFLARLWPR